MTQWTKTLDPKGPAPKTTRTFRVTVECQETRQLYSMTITVGIGEIYRDQPGLRQRFMKAMDNLMAMLFRALPVEDLPPEGGQH